MQKSVVRGVAATGGALVLFAVFGSGSAGAVNEYKGQTYADAVNAIQQAGQTAVIATKTGSFLPVQACTVTGSRSASFLDSSGNNQGGKVLLDLNCNYKFALPGVPGYSHASPEGKAAYDEALQKAQEQQQQQQQQQADQQAAAQGQG